MPMLTIQNECLKVTVSTLGAELQRVTDASGERLFDGDPAFWPNHAPVLFPYAGGLVDNAFTYKGVTYPAKTKHGFARRAEFRVESQSESSVTLLTDEPNEEYPFEYAFRVRYELEGAALKISYISRNTSASEPMIFGCGCHEALACPGGIEGCKVVFDRPYTLRHYRLDGAQIVREPEIIAENTDTLELRYDYFTVDALVFRDLNCPSLTLQRPDGHGVQLECADFAHLLIWTKPGAPYICLEPWTNPPEWVGASQELTQKSGMMTLQPGEEDTRVHTLRFF